jgi:hypothetical protein
MQDLQRWPALQVTTAGAPNTAHHKFAGLPLQPLKSKCATPAPAAAPLWRHLLAKPAALAEGAACSWLDSLVAARRWLCWRCFTAGQAASATTPDEA